MRLRHVAPALLCAMFAAAAFAATDHHPHWTYQGSDGPEHWGALDKEFAACAKGDHQSPVNLSGAQIAGKGGGEQLALDWKPFAPQIVNNGHTIQANAVPGNVTQLGGRAYTLQQMHFHHPSEHAIDGKRTPMEAHFVSKGDDGKLLVLGVLIAEGKPNEEIAKLWQAAPKQSGDAQAKGEIDFARLVPKGSKFYRYSGSLTTPPCSEIVDWVVFADPITASKEQIDAFAKLYPDNSRPVQALHDRTITFGR
jgi:carbonic anhydrase